MATTQVTTASDTLWLPVAELPQSAQIVPFRPYFGDPAVFDPVDRDVVGSQPLARWRKVVEVAKLRSGKPVPDGHLVAIHEHFFDRLAASGKVSNSL